MLKNVPTAILPFKFCEAFIDVSERKNFIQTEYMYAVCNKQKIDKSD